MKISVNGKTFQLTKSDYIGSGGEGTVYAKNGKCLKIFHDPSKVPPLGKIQELQAIQSPLVLVPEHIIEDQAGQPIGISTKYLTQVEYLCKYFDRGFRASKAISHQDITALVRLMQETLNQIHRAGVLVVDYNEMNFLVQDRNVFSIDVDSYQTPHYPATALMESVRDPLVTKSQFSHKSDWFSFGIVAFQLYTGVHPYKARHPVYGKDWKQMMEKGISIFDPQTRTPPNAYPLDVIPLAHRKWFEALFKHESRSPAPLPDAIATSVPRPTKIIGSEKFSIEPFFTTTGRLLGSSVIKGVWHIAESSRIIVGNKEYPPPPDPSKPCQFAPARGGEAVILQTNKLYTLEGNFIEEVPSGYVVSSSGLHYLEHSQLIEMTISAVGKKTVVSRRGISPVVATAQLKPNLVIQDILGSCRLIIIKNKACHQVHIPELERARILDGQYVGQATCLVLEKDGKYHQALIWHSHDFSSYTMELKEIPTYAPVKMGLLDKGVYILGLEDSIHLFTDLKHQKIIPNSPLLAESKLEVSGDMVFATTDKEIVQIKMR